MGDFPWLKRRGYCHFDSPVSFNFAAKIDEHQVTNHAWSPLIKYIKKEKKYKKLDGKTVVKPRPIMYASHRDACILSKYNYELCEQLEKAYSSLGLSDCVIAYRSMGKSNYHFAKEAQDFVRSKERAAVICLDVHGFFDNLDHAKLKRDLKAVLGVEELSDDWYRVFRSVTSFRYVELEKLKEFDDLKTRLRDRRHPLITILEAKQRGIQIVKNPNKFGIPQGTPISAGLSNLYMMELDAALQAYVIGIGGFYRRYSDDIIIACDPDDMHNAEQYAEGLISSSCLEVQAAKTERVILSGQNALDFQYLGFLLGNRHAVLRQKSLSKQWRAARRSFKNVRKVGERAIAAGKADRIYRRKICVKFTDAGRRNFLKYASRSAEELQSPAIKKQIKRLRRFVQDGLRDLKG